MTTSQTRKAEFRKLRIIALAIAAAPVFYLVVALAVTPGLDIDGASDFPFYIMLLVAMTTPAMAAMIERVQIQSFRRSTGSAMNIYQLLTSIGITRLALAEMPFILGLVAYLLSGDMMRMLIFYPVGAIWMFVNWPRRARWDSTLQKLENA